MDMIPFDTPTLIVSILAIVVIVVALIFRQKIRVNLKGPGGTALDVDASNQRPPTSPVAVVENAKSRAGGILAKDGTGQGARIKDAEAEQHIIASVTLPPGETRPKA